MRWAIFLILAYVVLLIQTTLAGTLAFDIGSLGKVAPDLPAVMAVFVALRARTGSEAMIAAWTLGLMLELASGGIGTGAIGPMSLAYVAGAAAVFGLHGVVFPARPLAQIVTVLMFCLIAHPLWVTLQAVLAWSSFDWSEYGRLLGQAALLACYSALLAPLAHLVLRRTERWMLPQVGGGRAGR